MSKEIKNMGNKPRNYGSSNIPQKKTSKDGFVLNLIGTDIPLSFVLGAVVESDVYEMKTKRGRRQWENEFLSQFLENIFRVC